MNRIYIKFLTRYLRKDRVKIVALIRRALNYALRGKSINNISLSVILVDNARIKDINRKFLGRNRITDVIAFPMSEDDSMGEFGEIIVSVEKAYHESRRRKIPTDGEIVLYCVHGLLHLLGYDDHSVKDSLETWERQLEILGRIFGKTKARGYLE